MTGRILVPVDGSEHAFRALEVACSLARAEGKKLRLLHVVPKAEIPDGLKRFAAVEHVRDSPEHMYEAAVAENILDVARGQAVSAGVEDVESSVEHGEASRGILEAASRGDVDTIVMGTRGLSDFQGLVLGSVAHRVGHGAECRVVTVR